MDSDQEEKYSILLIEKEKWAGELIESYINQYPSFVITNVAKTGAEAQRLLTKHQYDLIFMDIILPGMNGIKVLTELSYSPYVIFTTVKREFALKAFEIGVIDYLLKPITPKRFKIAIERAQELLHYRRLHASPKAAPVIEHTQPEIDLEEHLQHHYSLTSQEALICRYFYDGFSRNDIIDTLDIVEQTLKQHLRSIFAKTIDADTTAPSKKHGKMYMLINFLNQLTQLPSPDNDEEEKPDEELDDEGDL